MKKSRLTEDQIIGVLKEHQDQNRRMNKLLAVSMLDVATLKEALGKF